MEYLTMNSRMAVGRRPTMGAAAESGPTLYVALGRCAAMMVPMVLATSDTWVPGSLAL